MGDDGGDQGGGGVVGDDLSHPDQEQDQIQQRQAQAARHQDDSEGPDQGRSGEVHHRHHAAAVQPVEVGAGGQGDD